MYSSLDLDDSLSALITTILHIKNDKIRSLRYTTQLHALIVTVNDYERDVYCSSTETPATQLILQTREQFPIRSDTNVEQSDLSS